MHKKAALILIFMLLAAAVAAVLSRCTSCLSAQLEAIEDAVIQIRQLEELEDAALNIQTRAEYKAELAERFEEDFSDEDAADGLLFYRALDLVEPDLDLEAAYFDFLTAEIGGYYDPETDEMTVILDAEQGADDELPPPESLTYAHEFAHALQDQHYDLEALFDQAAGSDNYDFQLAMDALIEGDASLVGIFSFFKLQDDSGFEWWLHDPLLFIETLEYSANTDSQEAAESEGDIPAIIKATFMFPYEEGLKFVAYLVKELGWSGVDRAFRENPPRTTEHIYYPRRYLEGDAPIEVSPLDPGAVIGDGWRRVYDSSVGNFYLRHHLETHLFAAPLVTHGWGGDRMQLFADDASGDLLWVWQLAWDSARDANEFHRGYRIFLNQRYDMDGDGPCWTAAETHCFKPISETETRITYAADPTVAIALLDLDS